MSVVYLDRNVEHPQRFELKDINTGDVVATYDLVPAPGTITEAGTPVNAANLNDGVAKAGDLKWSAKRKADTGWIYMNGTAISRTTYAGLFDAICPPQNFTVTIASPAVFTAVAHGLKVNAPIRFTTTGALPTGLDTSTTYYVISTGLTADTFQVSTTKGGSAVVTTGTQSGTHTLRPFYFGVGDGSTTFNIPDSRGVTFRGVDDGRGLDMESDRVLGSYQGDGNKEHNHGSHNHESIAATAYISVQSGTGTDNVWQGNNGTNFTTSTATANSGATETTMKNMAAYGFIKY